MIFLILGSVVRRVCRHPLCELARPIFEKARLIQEPLFSVVGSLGAACLGKLLGFQAVLLLGAVIYLILGIALLASRARKESVTVAASSTAPRAC